MAGARDVDDPRGRLFEDYVRIVKEIKPKYFVMENVMGLISMEHDRTDLKPKEHKKLEEIKKLEKKKADLLLKRKQSKNTKAIKFSRSDIEDELGKHIESLTDVAKKVVSDSNLPDDEMMDDTIEHYLNSPNLPLRINVNKVLKGEALLNFGINRLKSNNIELNR